jgi:hypothetical protein
MNKPRILFAAAAVALLSFSISIWLLEQHYSFSPYRWASPQMDSDVSRSQWQRRRDVYITMGIISFLQPRVWAQRLFDLSGANSFPK